MLFCPTVLVCDCGIERDNERETLFRNSLVTSGLRLIHRVVKESKFFWEPTLWVMTIGRRDVLLLHTSLRDCVFVDAEIVGGHASSGELIFDELSCGGSEKLPLGWILQQVYD